MFICENLWIKTCLPENDQWVEWYGRKCRTRKNPKVPRGKKKCRARKNLKVPRADLTAFHFVRSGFCGYCGKRQNGNLLIVAEVRMKRDKDSLRESPRGFAAFLAE